MWQYAEESHRDAFQSRNLKTDIVVCQHALGDI
jgi:hypothetical protein